MGLAQVLCPLFGLLRFTQVVVAHRQIGMRLDHLDRFTLPELKHVRSAS
ncbi:hypothetical protein AAFM48_22165 [Burkholderia pseudomallei]